MKGKAEKVLFCTSFLPVTAFKVIARVGDATWTQAQWAVLVGLILAVVQFLLARRILRYNTYLEKTFLAYLIGGTIWVHGFPEGAASFFVDHSVALLYLALFLMALLPPILGFDPFTYAIARQWYPESVWGMPDFRLINFRITYVWSGIFLAACLSSYLGHGRPLFSIVIPMAMVIGIGVVFSLKYPDYYLEHQYRVRPEVAATVPDRVAELIEGMPLAFDPDAAGDLKAEIQFDVSGEDGGKWVISIAGGTCGVRRGEALQPNLTIETPGEVWVKIAKGEIEGPKALMEGLYRVKGDVRLLTQMRQLFGARKKG